jgi:alkylation response protein AidB-like acyl-CoA dehydrogenase
MSPVSPAGQDQQVARVRDGESARVFVDTHVVPVADLLDRAQHIPDELLRLVGQAGMWAPFLPPEVGGSGMTFATFGRMHEEVGRGCSSLRSLLTVHSMVAWAISRWGSREQRERWLSPLASGEARGAVCITEPEVGSDATHIATTAARTAGGWVLTGTKTWITGGQRASLFLVFAQAERGLAAFLVPRESPGVQITPIADLLGTRASMLATVDLQGAVVGPDALLGPEAFAAGMVLTATLDLGRYSVAAGSVGIVRACLEASVEYSRRRTVGGIPLRERPLIRSKITNMMTDVIAGRLLYERAGRLKDTGDAEAVMATLVAKYFAAGAAARHASEAVQIHGANGCGADYPVARYYRDAKVMEIIEGSTEIQQLTIADAAYQKKW